MQKYKLIQKLSYTEIMQKLSYTEIMQKVSYTESKLYRK